MTSLLVEHSGVREPCLRVPTPLKIMFKRTWSLSNAVCFKHDNNVCACAVGELELILFPVVNLLLEMDSATSVSCTTWKVSPVVCLFWRFFECACAAQFRPHYYFWLKNMTSCCNLARPFSCLFHSAVCVTHLVPQLCLAHTL